MKSYAICFALIAGLASIALAQSQGKGRGGGGDSGSGTSAWIENFDDSLDALKLRGWGIEQTGAPDSAFGIPGLGVTKSYDASNVTIEEGKLKLRLNLYNEGSTLGSSGALVYNKSKYGYGTYEWCMRLSSTAATPAAVGSPVSGSISAGFVYVNNSQTEIDFEQARAKDTNGNLQWWLYLTNWLNLKPSSTAILATALWYPPPPATWADFKLYKFTWNRNYIDFFVNDQFLARHSDNVPRASANVILNHWGTDNPDGFGGPAVLGERFFYVDWVRYTPPGGLPALLACPNP